MCKQIRILAIVPALVPSVNIGIIAPFQRLQKDGFLKFKVILPHMYKKSVLNDIDLVVFCRNTEPSELDMLKDIITKKIRYIYEIDDNFFRIPTDTPIGKYHRHPLRIDTLKKFISNASMVRVYSDILKFDTEKLNNTVVKNKLYFDTSLIENIQKDKKKKIRIIYATSRMADSQQEIFEVALKRIAVKFKDTVEIYFWGAKPTDMELKKLKNVYHLKPIYNYEKFIKAFYKMNFEIGLAPIFEGKFYNSKTNNKYREYGACEIAGIYSDELLYNTSVQDKVNGMLVTNEESSWYDALETLVLDDTLRNNIIDNAKKDISDNYTFSTFCQKWKENILQSLATDSLPVSTSNWILTKKTTIVGVLLDKGISKNLSNFKNQMDNLFRGSLLLFNSTFIVNKYDYCNVDYSNFFKYNKNIIIFSNNKEFIKFIDSLLGTSNNVILITNKDIKMSDSSKMSIFKIEKDSKELYKFYEDNYFNQLITFLDKKGLRKEKEYDFIDKLSNYWIIIRIKQKINNLMQRINGLGLRMYTYLKIFKINYLN